MSGWAAAAQAGIQLADTGLNFWMNERANAQRASLMREQMGWAEHMYDTRYQKTMQDMRKAGLNPILAYQQGAGSAPSGGGVPGLTTPNTGSAKDALMQSLNMQIMQQQLKNLKADEVVKYEDAGLMAAQNRNVTSSTMNLEVLRKTMEMQNIISAMEAEGAAITKQMLEDYPQLRQLDIIIKSLTGTLDAAGSAKSLAPKGRSKPVTSSYKDVRRLPGGRTVTETIHNR